MATKREVFMNTDNHETRIALLEQSIVHINDTLVRFEKRFDRIDEKFDQVFDKMDQRFDKVDKQFDKMESKMWTHFYVLCAAIASVAGMLAKTQGWF